MHHDPAADKPVLSGNRVHSPRITRTAPCARRYRRRRRPRGHTPPTVERLRHALSLAHRNVAALLEGDEAGLDPLRRAIVIVEELERVHAALTGAKLPEPAAA